MSYPAAIMFDLDDTIISFSVHSEKCWASACTDLARDITLSADELFRAINQKRKWFWSDVDRHREWRQRMSAASYEIVRLALEDLRIHNRELVNQLVTAHEDCRYAAIALVPGAIETLQHFKRSGVRMGLITNGAGAAQREKIERFELEPFFDHILIEGEFGMGKPNPEVYQHMLAQLDVLPSEVWMVGDNLEWEIRSPQSLGIYSVWVDSYQRGLPPSTDIQPDRIVFSIAELLALAH